MSSSLRLCISSRIYGMRTPCGPVAAHWTANPSHNVVPLCQTCLDVWLDDADEDPTMEPLALRVLEAA